MLGLGHSGFRVGSGFMDFRTNVFCFGFLSFRVSRIIFPFWD